MNMSSHTALLILWCFVVSSAEYVKSCKYWCKTEDERYYCCPDGKGESWKPMMQEQKNSWPSFTIPWVTIKFDPVELEPLIWWTNKMKEEKPKEKKCPMVRPICARNMDWYRPPSYCHCDDECNPDKEKCCYDVCLGHKTCKPAE